MSNKKRLRRSTVQRLVNAAQDLDATFFERNPEQRQYMRPATAGELKATDYPAGTQVLVCRLGACHRVRAFVPPKARSN